MYCFTFSCSLGKIGGERKQKSMRSTRKNIYTMFAPDCQDEFNLRRKHLRLSHDFFDQLEDLRQSAFDEDSDIRKDVQYMVDTYHYDENTTHGIK